MKNTPYRKYLRRQVLWVLAFCSSLILPADTFANDNATTGADPDGALDRIYPQLQRVPQPVNRPDNSRITRLPPAISNAQINSGQGQGQANAPFNLAQIRGEVQREQAALEELNRNALQTHAQDGERAAQVALGVDFAKEATQLGFAPAAANDALSDAIRWYSLAARRGFPGAPSLDQSGVRFFPIRVVREARN